MKKYLFSGLVALALPMIASAATLDSIIGLVDRTIKELVPIVISLAVLVFLYGVVKWLWTDGDSKKEGATYMVWGVIALFVMVSVWGLVGLLQQTFDIDNDAKVENPIDKLNFN